MEDSDFFSQELTSEERSLYDRQFRLQGWNQKLVKRARILIAGVGGLGCEIAKNLAMLGVGHLDLIDLDVIEHSNLNRQILFAGAKLGESKAKVAAEKLKEINPNITIKGHFTSLERLNPAYYRAADVIIGGLDSINGRLNLNAQCVRFKKPLIDGGVSGYHGHIYTVFPYRNACLECYPTPATESDEMAACTVVGVPRKRVHCVFKAEMAFKEKFDKDPEPKDMECLKFLQKEANDLANTHQFPPPFTLAEIYKIIDHHDPAIITINAVISSLQSHEALKILHWNAGITGLGEPISSYVIFNGMTMKFYTIDKKRNPRCLQCGEQVRRVDIKISRDTPCQSIIDTLVRMGFKLDLEMEPALSTMDFNMVRIVDPEWTPVQNELRDFELITAAGFKEGEIFVTLNIS